MPDPTPSASGIPVILSTPTRAAHTYLQRILIPNNISMMIWRMLIIVASLTGIITNSKNLADFLAKLLYFTIQSNLLLVFCMVYALWVTLQHRRPVPLIKGATTVYISITGLVYNLILARTAGAPPVGSIIVPLIGGTLSNDLLHIFVPLMAVLDWLFFDAHPALSWRYPLQWLIYPLAYEAFVLVRGLLVQGPFVYPYLHYPYPFLNVDKIGYAGVALNTLIYGVAFWLLGLAFVGVDRVLSRFYRT